MLGRGALDVSDRLATRARVCVCCVSHVCVYMCVRLDGPRRWKPGRIAVHTSIMSWSASTVGTVLSRHGRVEPFDVRQVDCWSSVHDDA